MNPKLKRPLLILGLLAVLSAVLVFWVGRPSKPEQEFDQFFAGLAVASPQYQKLIAVEQPSLAVKGDFCALDFTQSPDQFRSMVGSLGVAESDVLSPTGAIMEASSKLSPGYPWILLIRAHITNASAPVYQVRIEGRQPYD